MKPKPSRYRILDALRLQPFTINDLCTCLHMTRKNVEFHLQRMERDALIRRRSCRIGVGRPAYLYQARV
jgi:predicted ArsR family transcriptional regulator